MDSNVTYADNREVLRERNAGTNESQSSGVSWGAVIGGAFVAAAFYLSLLALGAGLGLSAVSPWSNAGLGSAAIGTAAIIWLVFTELIASGLGGYLTGRLRTKWVLTHTDEVFFRDTANGFLSWAVALVISVTLLASGAASILRGPAQPRPAVDEAYFVDSLFRSDRVGTKDVVADAEAGRILAHALSRSEVPADDQSYLVRLTAARTGLGLPEAEKRVSDVVAEARQAEDTARKVTAHFLLWSFLALLIGAFTASFAATIGGRQRDHMKAV
jgi:hypothetical protein